MNTPHTFFAGQVKTFVILASIALLVVLFYIFNSFIYKQKQGPTATYEPYRATLTGTQTCLPHKDTTGPQTLECAIGMQTDAGEYYATDFSLMSQTAPVMQNGERFTASGVVTPIERLSTDHWQKYNMVGIFSVTDSVQIERGGAPTFAWMYEPDTTLNPDGFPRTVVNVVATYPSGVSETKKVSTVEGSCNDLPDAEADSVPGTTTVQCYYAGFGYRFKITQGPGSYLVQRKEFEEASPDYNPPVAEYEVVAEFAL